jgi:hypothetical protein
VLAAQGAFGSRAEVLARNMDTAVRVATLKNDVLFVRTLLSGLGPLLTLQLLCGLQVYLILCVFPQPRHRPLRVALGLTFAFVIAAAASRIFDPDRCLAGAIAAGTLLAFHAPLRVAGLLSSPPAKPTLRRVLALVAVPASVIFDEDEGNHQKYYPSKSTAVLRPTAPVEPVAPLPAMRGAALAFLLAAMSAHLLPSAWARSSIYLLLLITTITYGFVNLSSSIAALLGHLRIGSPFCWPWFSPSLASFWAHRWNAPIASALRAGVYEPLVMYASFPRAMATLACFAASGVGHVAILYYIRQRPGMPLWFTFFSLHGVAVCVERLILDAKLITKRLHRRLYVTAFMLITAELLFVPALRDSHFFDYALHELATGCRLFENAVVLALRYAMTNGQAFA